MRGGLRQTTTIAVLFLLFTAVGEFADAADDTVLVVIESDGKFEVLHSRAQSTATGLVFFGLIGYGVEEGSRASEDSDREQAILKFLPSDSCRADFEEALAARLSEKGHAVSVRDSIENTATGFSHVIRVRIRACGFKLANSTSEEVSAFYAAGYAIDKAGEKPSKKMSDMLITGSFRAAWPELLSDPDRAAAEFESVRVRAGRRVANGLIYERPET